VRDHGSHSLANSFEPGYVHPNFPSLGVTTVTGGNYLLVRNDSKKRKGLPLALLRKTSAAEEAPVAWVCDASRKGRRFTCVILCGFLSHSSVPLGRGSGIDELGLRHFDPSKQTEVSLKS
jgi:hypothetical protein